MKQSPAAFISKLFDNKKFLIAFSLICALILWLVIDIGENPDREIQFSEVPVVVSEKNDDNGNTLRVGSVSNENVSVTINGPGYIVSRVSKSDISVTVSSYADVTKPGNYVLTLTATVQKSGCSVTKISPSYITVSYDYTSSADIPIEYDTEAFQKYILTDCEIYKTSLRSNSDGNEYQTLRITGPSETVASVEKVIIRPELVKETYDSVSTNFTPKFTFIDKDGNELVASDVTYPLDNYLRVVVYKTAEVSLTPTFTDVPEYYSEGVPSSKYKLTVHNELTNKHESIDKVTVKGPVETIETLIKTGVKLSPISFKSITKDNMSFSTTFDLSDGVEIADGTGDVTVTVSFGSLRTKVIEVDPSAVTFKGLSEKYSAATSYKKKIKITLTVLSSDYYKLTADTVNVSIDCSSITEPTVETKAVSVTVQNSIQGWVNSVDPTEVSVTIN